MISPSTRLGLLGDCTSGCDSNTAFKWKLYTKDYQWIWKEVINLPSKSDGNFFSLHYIVFYFSNFMNNAIMPLQIQFHEYWYGSITVFDQRFQIMLINCTILWSYNFLYYAFRAITATSLLWALGN